MLWGVAVQMTVTCLRLVCVIFCFSSRQHKYIIINSVYVPKQKAYVASLCYSHIKTINTHYAIRVRRYANLYLYTVSPTRYSLPVPNSALYFCFLLLVANSSKSGTIILVCNTDESNRCATDATYCRRNVLALI